MSKGRYHLFSNLIYILEKEMATHSSILAWRNLWREEPGRLLFMGSHSRTRLKQLSMHTCIGEGNGNPLQYSCLENPRDRGAWWAVVYGVAQSRTRLKWLSSSSSKAIEIKINKWDLIKPTNFSIEKEVINKKVAYKMGGNTCKWCDPQGFHFQNETAPTTQQQKPNNPIEK